MSEHPALVWFRDDLRIADNPALSAAVGSGRPLIAVYILDDGNRNLRAPGGAARWWLAGSLRSLADGLRGIGLALVLRRGRSGAALMDFARETGADRIYCNRRYGQAAVEDRQIEQDLRRNGIELETLNAALMFEPGAVLSQSGSPFCVFTPFWRAALARGEPRRPLPAPRQANGLAGIASDTLEAWQLEPKKPDWAEGLREQWMPGEAGATRQLNRFTDQGLGGYAGRRDRPDVAGTSLLSPYLRFGEISPFQIWHAVKAAEFRRDAHAQDVTKFLTELGWREFSYHLLDSFPI